MTPSRSSHVRLKIVALLASMTALWGFAAYVTVQDGLQVLFVNELDEGVGRPTESLVDALQQERRLSAVASVEGVDAVGDALAEARDRTDEAHSRWEALRDRRLVRWAASGALDARLAAAAEELAALGEVRDALDGDEFGRHAAIDRYSTMVDANLAIYAVMSSLDDQEIARQSRGLVGLSEARELFSRRDAILAGALADAPTARDITDVTMLAGAGRERYERAAEDLSPAGRADVRATVAGDAVSAMRQLEERFIAEAEPGQDPPVSQSEWDDTAAAASDALRQLEFDATDHTLAAAAPVATATIVRLVLAGGLGLIAVVAAVVVSVTTARSLIRQLERLRDAARDLAEDRLPRVVHRLSRGEPVDVAAEAPPLRFGNDEVGQVGQAFNAAQQTAVQAAVQQADLRRGVRDVFLSLARRTQNLVHKQIGVLDRMERREVDEDEMADLYRIDHLATRMRRNAENLIVLSGAAPGRTWRRPVPMIDVIRGAIAEVEDYQRVTLLPVQGSALEGRVVGDVVHLLAELIENAVAYSPPYAMVGVSGQRVAHGFVVEIEDRGLGMSDDELATANAQLSDPPDFSVADASRLGLYVVAKLAQRHGVRVHLRTSPYGGITAIVLLPQELVTDLDEPPEQLVMTKHTVPPAATPPADVQATSDSFGDAASSDGVASSDRAAPPGGRTPGGLPLRVRQASLPQQLAEDDAEQDVTARDPEQVRQAMSAYQRGTRRGRDAAADAPATPAQETPGDRPGGHEEG